MSEKKKRPKISRDELVAAMRAQSEHWDANKEKIGEEGRVKFLLTLFRMPASKKFDILNVCQDRTGKKRLTLDLFCEMCPTFPLVMAYAPVAKVDRLHTDNRATLPALLKGFMNAPFIKAYEDFYEQAEPTANGRAVALLFNRKGLRQGLVLHNGEGLGEYWSHHTEIVCYGGTRDEPLRLVLQSFTSLAEAIYNKGNGWRPDFAF